jgi:hypothetical protein
MNGTILFDRLAYIDRLKRSGVSDDHARAHAEAIDEALREAVATKRDLHEQIELLKRDLTIRIGASAITLFAALTAIKYFG